MLKIIYCFIFMCILGLTSFAQDTFKYPLLILESGDTLTDIKLKRNNSLSKEGVLTFQNANQKKQEVPIQNILVLFDKNKDRYVPELIENENQFSLVNYKDIGTIKFGQSLPNSKGLRDYFYSIDGKVINMGHHRNNILTYLFESIADFKDFHKTYNKEVYFEFKSMADLSSAYNAYKDPEQYELSTFPYKGGDRASFGPLISYNQNIFSLTGDVAVVGSPSVSNSTRFKQKYSFSTGLLFNYDLSRLGYLQFATEYTKTKMESSLRRMINNNIDLQVSLGFNLQNTENLKLGIGLGGSLSFHINSFLARRVVGGYVKDELLWKSNPINIGFVVSAYTMINNQLGVLIRYNQYFLNNSNYDVLQAGSIIKAKHSVVKLGLAYLF